MIRDKLKHMFGHAAAEPDKKPSPPRQQKSDWAPDYRLMVSKELEKELDNITRRYLLAIPEKKSSLSGFGNNERIASTFYGVTLGDMAGSPYEGWGIPDDMDPDGIELIRDDGKFTDDTVMTLAVMRACLDIQETGPDARGAISMFGSRLKEYAKGFPNAGYGYHFYEWAIEDRDDIRYRSFGNGSAMRAGIIGAMSDRPEDVIRYAFFSAIPSHSHPEGIKGAIVTAMLTWMAWNGYDKQEMLSYALEHYPNGMREQGDRLPDSGSEPWLAPDMTLEELQAFAPYTNSITCQYAVPEAIANFMNTDSYEGCLREAFRYWCDTDTVGAISGSFASAYHVVNSGLDIIGMALDVMEVNGPLREADMLFHVTKAEQHGLARG